MGCLALQIERLTTFPYGLFLYLGAWIDANVTHKKLSAILDDMDAIGCTHFMEVNMDAYFIELKASYYRKIISKQSSLRLREPL